MGFLPGLLFSRLGRRALRITPYKHLTSIPYVQGTSEKIRRVLNEAGVNVAIRPVHTIRHVLPLPKDPYTSEDIGSIKIKSNLHYTRGITPKRVTSCGAPLRCFALGLHSSEETSQRWRHCTDLTGPGIKLQTSRTDCVRLATELTGRYIGCIIYEIPCLDCNFVYIGQTKRGLKSRLAEHKRATLNQKPEQSALCVHAMEFEHNIDWINAKIEKVENNYSKRLVSEAWFVSLTPDPML